MQRRPLPDDDWLKSFDGAVVLAIAEVKAGLCDLNGPWTDRNRRIVHKVLAAVGLFPDAKIDSLADDLYTNGLSRTDRQVTLLLAFGRTENPGLSRKYGDVRQILWPAALAFIWRRFSAYVHEKAWHQPWDRIGEDLYALASRASDPDFFARHIEIG
jgi:hypothetical protein